MSSVRAAPPPGLSWQGSLDGLGAPSVDRSFATLKRIELAGDAWVDLVPGWLHGADTLLADLLDQVPWRAHEVPMYDQVLPEPRLSAWWGSTSDRPWPEHIPAVAEALTEHYGERFDSLGANLYRDGSDSVAWHGDRVYREGGTALVAVITLGCARRFLLRPTGGGTSVRLRPGPGDLLVMGGTCQRTWQHCVPKTAQASGPRVSVTLRPRRPGDKLYGALAHRPGG